MVGEKLARAQRVRSELGAFFENARVPVIVVQPDGHLVTANDAALAQYGWSLEELVFMRIHDLMAEPRAELASDLERASRGDYAPLDRRLHRRKDGSVAWVVPRAGPVQVHGETLIVSVLQDVSALVDAERESEQARNRLVTTDRLATLGRVAAGVAHEVNNPAAFVTLALPMVRERLTQGRIPEAMALLEEAASAVGQINEVMRELGGVARDCPRTVVELSSVVNGALRITSIEAERSARIVRSFEDGVVAEVRGARITQVVINLVLNAAQAIAPGHPERNRIEVRVASSRFGAVIEVADTGPGIPPEVAEHLFRPFFTTRAGSGGTGLGLWLSRTIVEEEGGTLSWRNRPEGGAVFMVELPVAQAETGLVEAAAS
jgi:PAS domain S-box-containing protein